MKCRKASILGFKRGNSGYDKLSGVTCTRNELPVISSGVHMSLCIEV